MAVPRKTRNRFRGDYLSGHEIPVDADVRGALGVIYHPTQPHTLARSEYEGTDDIDVANRLVALGLLEKTPINTSCADYQLTKKGLAVLFADDVEESD